MSEHRKYATDLQTSCTYQAAQANCNMQAGQPKDLSVDLLYVSSRTGIPTLVLKHMWSKAVGLLNNNKVLAALGCPSSPCIMDSRSQHKPHCVILNKDGQFECDNEYPNFLQPYICIHILAATENNQLLKEFIDSYCKFAETRKG